MWQAAALPGSGFESDRGHTTAAQCSSNNASLVIDRGALSGTDRKPAALPASSDGTAPPSMPNCPYTKQPPAGPNARLPVHFFQLSLRHPLGYCALVVIASISNPLWKL